MFFYMNPNPPMYVLKTWNEHLISFHSLMFCLKLSKEIVSSFSQVGIAIIVVLYVSQFHVLLNCSPCTPSHLRPLSIIITCLTCFARLTHLMCLRTQAPLPSSISTLRAFVFFCYKYRFVVPLAKEFNMGRNNHGYTQRCEFSVLD